MAEVVTPVVPFRHDEDGNPEFLITEKHNLSDVMRWAIAQAGPTFEDGVQELRTILDRLEEESKT